ncbi:transposase [Streptomyces sp. P5-A9]|uniref:transposase n=1 Tax=Streptomyces sp. P5-A9 TaxID=3071730 RepID=UPI003FCCFE0C
MVTAGQAGDAPAFIDVMARVRVPRRVERRRTRPDVVSADTAYSSRAIREHLHDVEPGQVSRSQRTSRVPRLRRGRCGGGRPPAFDREAYKQRNTVERCINRLNYQWGGIAPL